MTLGGNGGDLKKFVMKQEERELHDLNKKDAKELFRDLKHINLTAAAKCLTKEDGKLYTAGDFAKEDFRYNKIKEGVYIPKNPIIVDGKIIGMKDSEMKALNGYSMFIIQEVKKAEGNDTQELSIITLALLEIYNYPMDEETKIDINSLRLACQYEALARKDYEWTSLLTKGGILDSLSEQDRKDRKDLVDKSQIINSKAKDNLRDHLVNLYREKIKKEGGYDKDLTIMLNKNPWLKYEVDKWTTEELTHVMITGPEEYFDDRKEAMEVEGLNDPMEAMRKLDRKMGDAVDDLKKQKELLEKKVDAVSLEQASQLQEVIHSLQHMTYEKKTLLQDFLWNTHIAIQRDDTGTSFGLGSSLTLPVLEASYGNFLSQINLIGAGILTKGADGSVTVMPHIGVQLANSITSADQKRGGFMAVDTGLIYDYNNKVFYAGGQIHLGGNYRLSDASDGVGGDAHEKVGVSLRGSGGAVIGSNASVFKVLGNVWKSLSSRTLDVHYARDKRQGLMDDLKMKEKRFATVIQEALLSDEELTHAALYEKVITTFEIKSKDRAMAEQIAAFLLPEIARKKVELDKLDAGDKNSKSKRLAQELANDLRRHVQNQFVDNLPQGIKNGHISRASIGVGLSRGGVTPGVTWSYLTGKEYEGDSDDLNQMKDEIVEGSGHIMEVQTFTNLWDGQLNTILGIEGDGPKVENISIGRKSYIAFPEEFMSQDIARIVVPSGYKFEDYLVRHDGKLIIPEGIDITIHETRVGGEPQYLICLGTKGTGTNVTVINPYTSGDEELEQGYRTRMPETSKDNLEARLQAYTNEIIAVSKSGDVLETYNTDFDKKLGVVNKEFGDDAPFDIENSTVLIDENGIVTQKLTFKSEELYAKLANLIEQKGLTGKVVGDVGSLTLTIPQGYQFIIWYSTLEKNKNDQRRGDIIVSENPNQLLQINYEKFDETFTNDESLDDYCAIERGLDPKLEEFFLTDDFVQKTLFKIRYGDNPSPASHGTTQEYKRFLDDIAQGMIDGNHSYEYAEGVLRKYMKADDVGVDNPVFESWLSNEQSKKTLLHRIGGSLSRVWMTEFAHLKNEDRESKASELLSVATKNTTYSNTYTELLTTISNASNPAQLFLEKQSDIEKVLTSIAGKPINYRENNFLHAIYSTNNPKLLAAYRLAWLITPDGQIMKTRNISYQDRIKNTERYKNNGGLQKFDLMLRDLVIDSANGIGAWGSDEGGAGTFDELSCGVAMVARFNGNRQTGDIGRKTVFDPELVKGVQVSLRNLDKEGVEESMKNQFRSVTLQELFEGKNALVDTYQNGLLKSIRDIVTRPGGSLKGLDVEQSKGVLKEITNVTSGDQLITFLEKYWDQDRLGADVLLRMYGPCKNYGKQVVTKVRGEQAVKKDFAQPKNSVQLETQSVEVDQNVYYSVHTQGDIAYGKQNGLNLSFTADIGKKQETGGESITNPGIRGQIEEEINTSLENNPVGPIDVNGTQRVGFEGEFIGVQGSYYFDESGLVHWDGGRNFRRVANITSLSDLTTRIANEVRTRKFSGDYYDTLTPEEQIFMKDSYKKLRTIRFPNRRKKRKETLRQLRFQIKQDKKDRKYKTDTAE